MLRRRSRGRGSGGYDGRDSSDGDGGGWLPFRAVQMVMVHEIAHCVEMNHGRAFWALRGRLAGQLRELWERGYTGDGMWGVGRRVFGGGEGCVAGRGEDEGGAVRVCGGTFGRRGGGRKRKRKRERVGGDGRALGGDEGVKGRLEGGKNAKGRPRVAGSLRGRELRAAAAMARFEERREEGKDEESTLSGSETESEDEDAEAMGEAFEVDGSRMRDDKGRGMVKMCEDEDQDDVHVKREIEELQGLDGIGTTSRTTAARDLTAVDRTESRRAEGVAKALSHTNNDPPDRIRMEDIPQYVEKEDGPSPKNIKAVRINVRPLSHSNKDTASTIASQPKNPPATARTEISEPSEIVCPICSMSNGLGSLLCIACSHVLDTRKITRYWRCRSDACQGSQYINAADCGRCGICGARKDDDRS